MVFFVVVAYGNGPIMAFFCLLYLLIPVAPSNPGTYLSATLAVHAPDFQYNGPNCKQSPAAYYFFAGFLYQSRCNTPLDDTQPGKLG